MGDVNYALLGPSPVSEAWFEQRKVIGSTVSDSSPAAGSVFGGALISVVSMLVHCEPVSGSLYLQRTPGTNES
jgi:hypothetical protein